MRSPRTLKPTSFLLLALAGAAALHAGGTGVFQDDFELEGPLPDLCAWSSIDAPCESEGAFEARWTDETIEGCVPETSGSGSGYTYTICAGSVCPGAPAAGCVLTAHVTDANADFLASTVDFALTVDTAALPVVGTLFSTPYDCQLDITSAAGTVDVDLDAPACTDPYRFVRAATGATAMAGATFGVSGCDEATTLETFLSFIENSLLDQLESGLEGIAVDTVNADLGGTLLCAP